MINSVILVVLKFLQLRVGSVFAVKLMALYSKGWPNLLAVSVPSRASYCTINRTSKCESSASTTVNDEKN